MYLLIVGILAVSALGAASELLFRVDIDIPWKEVRKEIDDINFIQRTLSEASGINVITVKKAFDNRNVILVVDIQEICGWSLLTSAFTEKGYSVSVTPLQACSEYAMELGVNVTYYGMDEILACDVVDFFDVVFHDKGMEKDEYMAIVKGYFERHRNLKEKNRVVCYRSYGELPLRLINFGLPIPPEILEEMYQDVRVEAKTVVVVSKLQRFHVYTNKF